MLFLNEKDMRSAVTFSKVMDEVEDAYRLFAGGDFFMPHRPVVEHDGNTILYMPCFAKGIFGTKFLTLFPENPSRGLPYIDGLMLLNDGDTGKTTAILDGSFLTALRTGAAGGVGVRRFSRPDAKNLGLIGAGKQGFYQALYACESRKIENIYIYDPVKKDFDAYIEGLTRALKIKPDIHICGDVAELLKKSDIVMIATTSQTPVVPDDPALLKGKCFVAIGSYKPHMRELPNAIWQVAERCYTELPFACEESGDLCQPLSDGIITKDRISYMGDYFLENPKPLPPAPGETTYFKSVGMGLMDLCVADLIYQEALKKGIGQELAL